MSGNRQIVLDTETTGLEWSKGHRVIEIGCIELVERRPTGNNFHHYLNPERAIDAGAAQVTGLTEEFLSDKPVFATIAEAFIDYVRGAELIIHNAEFDLGFLDHELGLCQSNLRRLTDCARVIDTLAMARERFPGKRNSLDALCSRFEIDNQHRKLHGALLDAQLLAEVYLAMTSGQGDLGLVANSASATSAGRFQAQVAGIRPLVMRAGPEEREQHARMMARIEHRSGEVSMWSRFDGVQRTET